jgi:hypothetical protein
VLRSVNLKLRWVKAYLLNIFPDGRRAIGDVSGEVVVIRRYWFLEMRSFRQKVELQSSLIKCLGTLNINGPNFRPNLTKPLEIKVFETLE